jgi:hypothetical protein
VLLWNRCTYDQKTEVLELAQQANGEAWLNNSFDLLSYFYLKGGDLETPDTDEMLLCSAQASSV